MNKLLFLLVVILLQGCTNPTELNKAKAKYLCSEHGGVITWHTIHNYPITCADGTKIDVDTIDSTIIPKEYLKEAYSK